MTLSAQLDEIAADTQHVVAKPIARSAVGPALRAMGYSFCTASKACNTSSKPSSLTARLWTRRLCWAARRSRVWYWEVGWYDSANPAGIEEAQAHRAPSEQWVEKFARIYTPAMMALAFGVAVIPPMLFGGEVH